MSLIYLATILLLTSYAQPLSTETQGAKNGSHVAQPATPSVRNPG